MYRAAPSSAIRLAVGALGSAADAVGHHHQQADPLALAHELVGLRQTGELNHGLPPQRADQEMVLVVGADFPGMGESVDVDLVVPGLPVGCGGGSGQLLWGHRGLLCAGARGVLSQDGVLNRPWLGVSVQVLGRPQVPPPASSGSRCRISASISAISRGTPSESHSSPLSVSA